MTIQIGSDEKRHPMQVVVRRTGLTPDVLRVWEKRYAVVEPGRSEGGHRMYSDDDVERLLLLNRVTSAGRRISQMAALDMASLQELAEEDAEAAFVAREAEPGRMGAEPHLAACLAAVNRMEARQLETSLMRATVALPAPVLIEQVVGPLLERIGEQWKSGFLTPGQEHLASAVIRRVLESIMNACAPESDAPTIVVTTPAGQAHEFGALLVGAASAAMGWRVMYLGTSLPGRDIAEVARTTGATVVALSIVYQEDDPDLALELRSLRDALHPGTEIIVGGRAASAYIDAVEAVHGKLITSLAQLVGFLGQPVPEPEATAGVGSRL